MQRTTSLPKLAGAIMLFVTGNASAENLSTVYSLAETNDPQFRAAKALYQADSEAPYQAWGAVLPQINASLHQTDPRVRLTNLQQPQQRHHRQPMTMTVVAIP